MKEVTSVLEFANAAAIERINYELAKVIENIQNPNTDEKPRYIHEAERLCDIKAAIARYMDAGYPIPAEWVKEYNELIAKQPR